VPDEECVTELGAIPGIGPWTAENVRQSEAARNRRSDVDAVLAGRGAEGLTVQQLARARNGAHDARQRGDVGAVGGQLWERDTDREDRVLGVVQEMWE
jgi:hypothetical protein